jgi:hypothetical protein
MMSIMTELTAKSTREGGSNSIIISPLMPVVIAPLGVLIPLILVAPSRLVLLGVIPTLTWVCYCSYFFLSFWHYSTGGSDLSYSVVQNFDIAEGERVEKNSPLREDVLVVGPWEVEDQEMESIDSVGVVIFKVHKKVWHFH